MYETQMFTDDETNTWGGGFYELSIELGLRSETRLEAALLALWQNARLDGCYVRRDLNFADQQRVKPSLAFLSDMGTSSVSQAFLVAARSPAARSLYRKTAAAIG